MKFKDSERQPIAIQNPEKTQDNTGGFTLNWTTLRTPIAEVMQRTRGSIFNDEAYSSESTYVFRVRVDNKTPNINNTMRILYRAGVYQVESVKRIGRGLVDVTGVFITSVSDFEVVWILEQGFWNKNGNWLVDGYWIKEPTT